ncbi:hypothetical protein CCL07_06185, partial [Pseudomonas congelans]
MNGIKDMRPNTPEENIERDDVVAEELQSIHPEYLVSTKPKVNIKPPVKVTNPVKPPVKPPVKTTDPVKPPVKPPV